MFNKKIIFIIIIILSISGCCIRKSLYQKKVDEFENCLEQLAFLESEHENLRLQHENMERSKDAEISRLNRIYSKTVHQMETEIKNKEITMKKLQNSLSIKILDSILFESGCAEISPEGYDTLFSLLDILKNVKDENIIIRGHTDDVKISKVLSIKYPTNWELSAIRAVNVARFFEDNGIDPVLLIPSAYSKYTPVGDNKTDEGRAQNRRIEIVLVPRGE